jgi:DNA invertase Pin-like site-specific DNA recombinase
VLKVIRMKGSRRNTGRLRAVIYVLLGRPQSAEWLQRCHKHVERMGYQLYALSEETDEEKRPKLADAINTLTSGEADVLVVADADYLPGDWVPRLEVARDDGEWAIPPENRAPDAPRQRRPRPPSKR